MIYSRQTDSDAENDLPSNYMPLTVNHAGEVLTYDNTGSGNLTVLNSSSTNNLDPSAKTLYQLAGSNPQLSFNDNWQIVAGNYVWEPSDGVNPPCTVAVGDLVQIGSSFIGTNCPKQTSGSTIMGKQQTSSGSVSAASFSCELRLLNGSTSVTDLDGITFGKKRPQTISATSPDNTTVNQDLIDNGNQDILGTIPLGQGRPDIGDQVFVGSLLVIAKVAPTKGASYRWGRVYQDRSLIITNVASAHPPYWYVKSVNDANYVTGYPTNKEDTDDGPHQTTTPSSKNILYTYDAPGMALTQFQASINHGPWGTGIHDYAYEKTDFTYFLTNVVGTTTNIVTKHVGQRIIAQRIATSGSATNQWKAVTNILSTTNIPICNKVTQSEIRAIVGGTNLIVISPNATNNIPNP